MIIVLENTILWHYVMFYLWPSIIMPTQLEVHQLWAAGFGMSWFDRMHIIFCNQISSPFVYPKHSLIDLRVLNINKYNENSQFLVSSLTKAIMWSEICIKCFIAEVVLKELDFQINREKQLKTYKNIFYETT